MRHDIYQIQCISYYDWNPNLISQIITIGTFILVYANSVHMHMLGCVENCFENMESLWVICST